MPTQTLTLRVSQHEALTAELRRLARHARRLGLSEPTATIVPGSKREELQNLRTIVKGEDEAVEHQRDYAVEVVDVVIDTPEMGLSSGEHRTLAALQNLGRGDDGKPMIEVFAPDVESAKRAEAYRSATFCCDHCKTTRNRNWMILAEEKKTGNVRQLGSECADVFVSDPMGDLKKLQFQELLVNVVRVCDGDEERSRGGSGSGLRTVDALELATHAIASSRHAGWTSRWIEDDHGNKVESPSSTGANIAVRLNLREARTLPRGNKAGAYEVTEEDQKQATEAIAWIGEAKDDNEFLAGLKLVYGPGWVSEKKMYMAASLASAWQREKDRRIQDARPPSEYVGTPKGRIKTEVHVKRTHSFETQWGQKNLYTMEDRNGNSFIWSSSGAGLPETSGSPENWFAIKGTVKDHKEYRGVKQTELARVVVEKDYAAEKLEEVEAAKVVRVTAVRSLSVEERCALASSLQTESFLLERLFEGETDARVRAAIAGNPSTPASQLARIAYRSDDLASISAACQNPSTPLDTLYNRAESPRSLFAGDVARNPSINDIILRDLARHEDPLVRQRAAEHPVMVSERAVAIVEKLLRDPVESVRNSAEAAFQTLLTNAKTTLEVGPPSMKFDSRIARLLILEQQRAQSITVEPQEKDIASQLSANGGQMPTNEGFLMPGDLADEKRRAALAVAGVDGPSIN